MYCFIEPSPELTDHIEFYAESCPVATSKYIGAKTFSVKMFPSWTPTFFINLGGPYKISISGHIHHIGPRQDILVGRNSKVERFNKLADNIFTVKFHPGGLEAVTGYSQWQSGFANSFTDLRHILPGSLLERLRQPLSFEKRHAIMEDYLMSALTKQKRAGHYLNIVRVCIEKYDALDMQPKANELSQKVFASTRTINRHFNRVIGVSPKRYLSVLRARTALTAYVSVKKDFSPIDFGYYDMSHFYREIKSFTGRKLIDQVNA
ncbi:MAG TPA: helix-turn-helix domain-containing protein [Puia sp.]|nr:helix-turn-helix domain-containing protein [Puia sp.]